MEQTGPSEERPKVRVVKGGKGRPRSGVITVQGENGDVFYRCSCDRCDGVATTSERPIVTREVVCEQCIRLVGKMKPSTKIKRRSGKPVYTTDCDECGTPTKTFFLPKNNRPLLCKECIAEAEELAEMDARDAGDVDVEPIEEPKPAKAGIYEAPEVAADAFHQVRQQIAEKKVRDDKFIFPCRRCSKELTLRFMPKPGEDIICPDCYKERNEREAKKNPTGTRIFYNIECARCGRKESLHFVPRLGSDAVCSTCFNNNKRR